MKKRNKRIIAAVMAAVMVGTVGVGLNSKNVLKSSADEASTREMTIKECSEQYSAVNYLTRGINIYTAGSPVYNVGDSNSLAIDIQSSQIFTDDSSEVSTRNWKVLLNEEPKHSFKQADDNNFAEYIEEYSREMSIESSASAKYKKIATGDYEACVNLAKQSNKTNSVSTYYRTVRTSLITGNIKLIEDNNIERKFTQAFIDDAFGLLDSNSGSTFDSFIRRYGTHFVKHIQMGGRFQLNYSICSNNASDSESLTNEVNAALDAKLDFDKNSKTKNNVNGNNDNNSENNETENNKDKDERVGGIVDFLTSKTKETSAKFGAVTVIKEVQTVGPRFEGDIEEWYNAVQAKPQCIGMAEQGAEEVLTVLSYMNEENTGHSQAEINELKAVLRKELNLFYEKMEKEQDAKAAEFGKNNNNNDNNNTNETTIEVFEPVSGPTAYKVKSEFSNQAVLDENVQKLHEGYKVGELIVSNKLVKNTSGCYNYGELGKMKISFKMGDSISNLPVGNTEAASHTLTSSRTNISYIFGKLNLLGIRNGAYYIEVEYRDGTNEIIAKDTNIFDNARPNGTIDLCSFNPNMVSTAMQKGGITKINVNLLYNTTATYAGSKDKFTQDWKNVYTIDFTK